MELTHTRRLICKAHNPKKVQPPKSCVDAKTIGFDTFQTKLLLFRDSRPEAQTYIKEVLPTLLVPPNTPDHGVQLYNTLEANQWLEFDFTTNTLYLCSLH